MEPKYTLIHQHIENSETDPRELIIILNTNEDWYQSTKLRVISKIPISIEIRVEYCEDYIKA